MMMDDDEGMQHRLLLGFMSIPSVIVVSPSLNQTYRQAMYVRYRSQGYLHEK